MIFAAWQHPLCAVDFRGVLSEGDLIAAEHAVWRVTGVGPRELEDHERQRWLDEGMPDLQTWRWRPIRVEVVYVGGYLPEGIRNDPQEPDTGTETEVEACLDTVAAQRWSVYPEGRWPQCSCCGEPMPCRAELQDRQVRTMMARWDRFSSRLPGCCWSCAEPITSRQAAVTYPGENLDLPGGIQVSFHTRQSCLEPAMEYEDRWVSADPRRDRILTWPSCDGTLVVHHNGSSECRPADGRPGHPDCRGHLTHDHGYESACYAYFRSGCPRGCARQGHPGIRHTPRPPRGQQTLPIGES